MLFRQNEFITSEYVLYIFSVLLLILLIVYFVLRYIRSNLLFKRNSNSKDDVEFEKIRLSTKTTLYIIDRKPYEIFIIESEHGVVMEKLTNNIKIEL